METTKDHHHYSSRQNVPLFSPILDEESHQTFYCKAAVTMKQVSTGFAP